MSFFVDVFAYDLNFYVDQHKGDKFRVLVDNGTAFGPSLGVGLSGDRPAPGQVLVVPVRGTGRAVAGEQFGFQRNQNVLIAARPCDGFLDRQRAQHVDHKPDRVIDIVPRIGCRSEVEILRQCHEPNTTKGSWHSHPRLESRSTQPGTNSNGPRRRSSR